MAKLINAISHGFSINISSRRKGNQLLDNHIHDYHEIYFMLEGNARHFINNEIINTEVGQLVIVKKGYIHKTMYEPEKFSQRLLICFDDGFVGDFYHDIADKLGKQKYMPLSLSSKLEIENIIRTLYSEYVNKDSDYLEMCKNLLRQLLIIMYRQKTDAAPRKLSNNEIIIQNASQYITDNYREKLTLEFLAKKYAMSQSHFSKTFKFYTGFGVSEYITLVRVRNAEKMLRKSPVSITEVAYSCGFNDSNYFTSVFKKHKGITPLKYAILNRNAKSTEFDKNS